MAKDQGFQNNLGVEYVIVYRFASGGEASSSNDQADVVLTTRQINPTQSSVSKSSSAGYPELVSQQRFAMAATIPYCYS